MSKLDEYMVLWIRIREIRTLIKSVECPLVLKQLSDEIDDIMEEMHFITERNYDGSRISI